MSTNIDLRIQDAQVVAPDPKGSPENPIWKTELTTVDIADGKIIAIGEKTGTPKQVFNAKGLHLLPGAIDTQVHFRDPGFPEKETIGSGSRAAIFGGVTSFFEMPNTKPPTLTAIEVQDKLTRARANSWVNFAFYVGASPSNIERLGDLEKLPGVCGVKMFMGSSTGNLVIGRDENIRAALQKTSRRMAIHAEDEDRMNARRHIVTEKPGQVALHPEWRDAEAARLATEKILKFSRELNRKIHVLHVTTAEEVELLTKNSDLATFEITPQHLTLCAPECYEKLGTLAQMNPPIRDKRHQDALWAAVSSGKVTLIGSDHAPHTLDEKKKTYPESPSGMPGVQTILPLMIHHALNGKLDLMLAIQLLTLRPALTFGIAGKGVIAPGYDADFTLVDLKKTKKIENSWIKSICGWTPYDGMTLNGCVSATIIAGHVSMRDDELMGAPRGKVLKFQF